MAYPHLVMFASISSCLFSSFLESCEIVYPNLKTLGNFALLEINCVMATTILFRESCLSSSSEVQLLLGKLVSMTITSFKDPFFV